MMLRTAANEVAGDPLSAVLAHGELCLGRFAAAGCDATETPSTTGTAMTAATSLVRRSFPFEPIRVWLTCSPSRMRRRCGAASTIAARRPAVTAAGGE
jgi:hypothetical protein